MIVRILNEGQWRLDDSVLTELNALDDAVEQAVEHDDEAELAQALHDLLEKVRASGEQLADGDLADSDLILPASDASIHEVRDLLSESDEGLVPN